MVNEIGRKIKNYQIIILKFKENTQKQIKFRTILARFLKEYRQNVEN